MRDTLRWFVTLQSGTTFLHCWVDKHVRINQDITLKDSDEPERRWNVLYVSSQARFISELHGQRGWHVGGL